MPSEPRNSRALDAGRSARASRLSRGLLASLMLAAAAVVGRVQAHDTSGAMDFIRNEAAQREQAEAVPVPAANEAPARPVHRPVSHVAAAGGHAVCVRLCDGFFFPVDGGAGAAAQESTCAGLCPGAPTRVYLSGGDGIRGAVSRDGHPYSALPVALRYTKTTDNTCSCKRSMDPQAALAALTQDPTLRRGDVVMTPKGLLVFNGSNRVPYQRDDFATLAEARSRIGNAASLAQLEGVAQLPVRQDVSEASPIAASPPPPPQLSQLSSAAAASAASIQAIKVVGSQAAIAE